MTTGALPTATAVPVEGTPLLRWSLRLDGAVSGVNGLVYALGAGAVRDLLGLPTALLVPVGAFLVVYGAVLTGMSVRATLPRVGVRAVILLNAAWAAASVTVVAAGWFDLTAVGIAWVLLQAGAVAGFALAQLVGMRRAASY